MVDARAHPRHPARSYRHALEDQTSGYERVLRRPRRARGIRRAGGGGEADAMSTTTREMSGTEIVELCRRHTFFEWSAQGSVDPIPMARAKGVYFWTPEGKRYIDFNSQLMCVNIGHGDERVTRAIADQAASLPYASPFMATEARARLGAKLA